MENLFTRSKRKKGGEDGDDAASSASVLYLRSAIRLLARESKQRQRLAFLATSSVALPGDDGAMEDGTSSIARKLAGQLSHVDSVRARARRRRAQVG